MHDGGAMTPDSPSHDDVRRRQAAFVAARRWEGYHTPKNLAMALAGEVGELLELFQWLTPDQAAAIMDDQQTAHLVRDELADVGLYLTRLAEVLGVDLLAAMDAKIDRNEQRFPIPDDGTPAELTPRADG